MTKPQKKGWPNKDRAADMEKGVQPSKAFLAQVAAEKRVKNWSAEWAQRNKS